MSHDALLTLIIFTKFQVGQLIRSWLITF